VQGRVQNLIRISGGRYGVSICICLSFYMKWSPVAGFGLLAAPLVPAFSVRPFRPVRLIPFMVCFIVSLVVPFVAPFVWFRSFGSVHRSGPGSCAPRPVSQSMLPQAASCFLFCLRSGFYILVWFRSVFTFDSHIFGRPLQFGSGGNPAAAKCLLAKYLFGSTWTRHRFVSSRGIRRARCSPARRGRRPHKR
jgi:hypothetical protein